MYHISDCKKYTKCPHYFVNETEVPKGAFQPYVRLDEEITAIAAQKLGVQDCFLGQKGDAPTKALEALNTYEWLVKARFEYKNLRIKVPFLHKNEDCWDIYFLFAGLYPHADDLQFYCDTIWVLENLGIQLENYYVIHLNAQYVRGKEIDPDALFIISSYFYNHKNNPTLPVKETINEKMEDLTGLLKRMEETNRYTLSQPVRTSKCTIRQKCKYYEQCFPEEMEEPANSILTLISSQYKYAMKNEGRLYLRDTDIHHLEGFRQQYSQIMADRQNGLFVDRMALRSWLSDIHYPIAFLDFEWERFAIPPYEGMRPYDVLPFEYSLHVLHEDGTITQEVYLSIHDDRKDMAEHLIRDIPEEGTIIAYNAEGAEKLRLQELADTFPEYRAKLLNMCDRLEDLQIPFMTGTVYNTAMKGQWSLKCIMGFLDEKGYRDLDIRQGMEAVFQWRHLDHSEDDQDLEKIVRDLKEYCQMDSYAMIVVYQWLEKLAQMHPFEEENQKIL